MSDLKITIKNIRNISNCCFEMPLDSGLYSLVGENGCGKSTMMLALSLLVKPSSIKNLLSHDYQSDSIIDLDIDGTHDHWYLDGDEWTTGSSERYKISCKNRYRGFYEGSIFYGSRFYDYNIVSSFMDRPNYEDLIRPSDSFVIETLSYILHGNKDYYKGLYKVKTKDIAKDCGFRGIPYFLKVENHYISQYSMSSGESMLISLIDFVNNLTERNKYSSPLPLLFLIDEAELALHPAAIDRLVTFFSNMIKQVNMVVLFSTHSTEIINRIQPQKIYMLENDDGTISVLNPCYPNYAIRNLYVPNGYDFIILVEDELAKAVIERFIRTEKMCSSRLWYVVPSGGWHQTLKLQYDIQHSGLLGIGRRVISVLDGDVQIQGDKKAAELQISKFSYLPIPSVEKYLRKKLILEKDAVFTKLIGDKYFTQRALPDIINDYKTNYRQSEDDSGKKLYKMICSNLLQVSITIDQFIQYLCEDICEYEDFSDFISKLNGLLS